MSDKAKIIGARIKKIREFLGMTQAKLAHLAGITPAAVSQIEAGQRMPAVSTIINLAKSLNVTTDRILLGENHP